MKEEFFKRSSFYPFVVLIPATFSVLFFSVIIYAHDYELIICRWGGEGSCIPEGLIFDGVLNAPRTLIGASAAQSSSIQCFDAALGIVHEPRKIQYLLQSIFNLIYYNRLITIKVSTTY